MSRSESEQLVVDPDVVVTILQVRGGRVLLGISAPDLVRIIRAELRPADDSVPETTREDQSITPHAKNS